MRLQSDIPYLAEMLGVWAIHPENGDALLRVAEKLDLNAHLADERERRLLERIEDGDDAPLYQVNEHGVAVIGIEGPMARHASSLTGGASTLLTRRAVQAASRDESVSAIALVINSPGGTVAGTDDLALAVANARTRGKPVWALVEDMCCSAAYWVASQATKIVATRSSVIGSIGVYTVLVDQSEAAEARGLKVHVVKFGSAKAIGVAGAEVTDEQLAEVQRMIDERGRQFVEAVASGRSKDLAEVALWADGRVHTAKTAQGYGMIDAVASVDEALADLAEQIAPKIPEPMNARELRAAIVEGIGEGAHVGTIMDRLADETDPHRATVRALQIARELDAEARQPVTESLQPLVEVVRGADVHDDSRGSFTEMVEDEVRAGLSRFEAVKRVAKRYPELREAMLAEANPSGFPTGHRYQR